MRPSAAAFGGISRAVRGPRRPGGHAPGPVRAAPAGTDLAVGQVVQQGQNEVPVQEAAQLRRQVVALGARRGGRPGSLLHGLLRRGAGIGRGRRGRGDVGSRHGRGWMAGWRLPRWTRMGWAVPSGGGGSDGPRFGAKIESFSPLLHPSPPFSTLPRPLTPPRLTRFCPSASQSSHADSTRFHPPDGRHGQNRGRTVGWNRVDTRQNRGRKRAETGWTWVELWKNRGRTAVERRYRATAATGSGRERPALAAPRRLGDPCHPASRHVGPRQRTRPSLLGVSH